MNVTTANVRLGPGATEKLVRQLRSPKNRSAAGRILNSESREVLEIAREITEKEIHRRPDDRRTKISLAHGKELHDSWEIVPAREVGLDRMRVSVRNTHPAFRIINNGSRSDYPIVARNAKTLAFPFKGPVGRGRPGQRGTFAVLTGDAASIFPTKVEHHPGVGAHQILQRSLRIYRRRKGRVINGRYG